MKIIINWLLLVIRWLMYNDGYWDSIIIDEDKADYWAVLMKGYDNNAWSRNSGRPTDILQ